MSSPLRRAVDRALATLSRRVLEIFFREIEIVGTENVPPSGPLLVVANHGNSLVDPMLVLGFLPRRSRFLAKSTLWRHPTVKYLVRLAAAIPVYRRQDPGVDPSRNLEAFARSHEVLAAGGVIALFPEGLSHSEPALAPLKTGVARIALGAEERFGPLGIRVVPVGLNYENREVFRSRVLVRVGAPISIGSRELAAARDPGSSPGRADGDSHQVRALTARVEDALRGVTLNYDTWRQAELLDCAAQVYSRDEVEAPQRAPLSAQFELKKRFLAGFRELERLRPDEVEPVLAATQRYDGLLRDVGLEDRHVAATYPSTLVVRFLLSHLWSLTLWRPLALVGAILNWLPYKIPGWVTRLARLAPDVRATWKVLVSLVVFPLFWLLEALLVGWRWGFAWGLVTAVLAPASGYLALTYYESWRTLREESRAFLTIKGRQKLAAELIERRGKVAEEVHRLVAAYGQRFAINEAPPRVE